jgi:hypothetical protein
MNQQPIEANELLTIDHHNPQVMEEQLDLAVADFLQDSDM